MAFFNSQTSKIVLLVIGAILVLLFLNQYMKPSAIKNDGDIYVGARPESGCSARNLMDVADLPGAGGEIVDGPLIPEPGSPYSLIGAGFDGLDSDSLKQSCFRKELESSDLLPLTENTAYWGDVDPTGSGLLQEKNFLHAGHHIGINSVGQSLRNPNYQLRSEPPNPQVQVSPWVQSTIAPDLTRRPLEIGGCE